MPEAIKLNRGKVRLDAIYRATSRALSHRDEAGWVDLRELFTEVSARDCASAATSRDRFEALLRFVRVASDQRALPTELSEAYRCFVDFEKSPEISEVGSLLAEEDEEALTALGTEMPGVSGRPLKEIA